MDPVAHTLVGAALAESGLKRRSPLATATLIAGANIPDIDAVATALGRDTSLLLRRGHTHGVVAMVLLPLLLTGLVMLYDRRIRNPAGDKEPIRPGVLLAFAYLSTLSHPALDWMNTYGVRLLMPFDGRWFYGDSIFIIDPWIWLLAGTSVVLARSSSRRSITRWIVLACMSSLLITFSGFVPWPAQLLWFASLVAIVLLRRRGVSAVATPQIARACLAALLVYLGSMVLGTHLARERARAWLETSGTTPSEVMAGPMPANPFQREIIAVTDAGYRFLAIDAFADPGVRETSAPVTGDVRTEIIQAALAAPSVRGLSRWMRFPSYQVEPTTDGWRVTIRDVRYARAGTRLGYAVVELDAKLRPRP